MTTLRHLSASSIATYQECPLAFYGRYIAHWPESHPPMMVTAMALGRVVHSALEAHHQGLDAVVALCEAWGKLGHPMPSGYFAKALELTRLYTSTEPRDPRDVTEQKFRLEVPGVPVPIIGYIDCQRGLVVKEFKTTGSATWWTQERADSALQVTIYSMHVAKQNHGGQASAEIHVLSHRDNDYTHTVLHTTRNKADQEEGREIIRSVWAKIQDGELNAVCKSGSCRFPEHCREYGYVGPDTRELIVMKELSA